MVEEQRRAHLVGVQRLLAERGIEVDDPRVELLKGGAASLIRERAKALSADLIVMGTVGRTGIPGFFIGNTAEEVLQTTNASFLALKPAGFVSPVRS